MLPKDGLILSALATATLQTGDLVSAATRFQTLAEEFNVPEGWAGLALCARLLGQNERALVAIVAALRSTTPTPSIADLATQIAGSAGAPGWCGLTTEGVLRAGPGRPRSVRLDDTAIALRWVRQEARLPAGWEQAEYLHVETAGAPWAGSPLPVARLCRMEGFVETVADGIAGWAWYPADPARDPTIQVHSSAGHRAMPLSDPAEGDHARPLGRPRRFAAGIQACGTGRVSVTDAAGHHLLGSPLDVWQEQRAARATLLGHPAAAPGPVWADVRGPPAERVTRRGVAVVIPAYRGRAQTLACVESVRATVPPDTIILVVDDASPDRDLAAALAGLARSGQITLRRLDANIGFPGAANAGMQAYPDRDIILLNSDTLVPPGWLQRLRTAAYSAPDIGTVTPLSNDATILSYPDIIGENAVPDAATTAATDRVARLANGSAVVEIPTGVGFCLYIRRDCLDHVGPLREDVFAQGYGEENDFCLRARHLGWRSVAAPGVFVAHVGGQSFGSARRHLIRRNAAVLNRLHPGYDAVIAAHIAADPVAPHRRRMDERRWEAGRQRKAVILITHGGGGGLDVVVAARCAAAVREGARAIVLRPAPAGCRVTEGAGFPNLIYAVPSELPALTALLRDDRPTHIELHHRLGHAPDIMGLAAALGVPWDVYVHDYAWFCQRIALVSHHGRYCGEPEMPGCQACIADLGTLLEEEISVPALVERSTLDLTGACQVYAPSRDAALRITRHFPTLRPVITPWEDDTAWPTPMPVPAAAVRRVCIIGAIGREKGYDVLLGCARDARARSLPLEFVVVGYTEDDPRLMDSGPVWITGEFTEAEAVALIREQAAHLAFIPSIWPETWCFALSRAWQAGLPAMAFDLGAPAERIRATGRGWLLPLGLSPAAVNDALLALAPIQ